MNISFLYPSFLWAFTLLSIPIIIHLFNFRKYKVVYFSNIELLKNVQTETKSKSRLKHLLVLLLRLLFLSALILAFAQPTLKTEDKKLTGINHIVLDNSFSANGTYEEGRILDNLKRTANHIIDANGDLASFRFSTQNQNVEEAHNYYKEEAVDLVTSINESFYSESLNELSQKATYFNQENAEKITTQYILSDFQKNNFNLDSSIVDTNIQYKLIPFTPTITANISIDSIKLPKLISNINEPFDIEVYLNNHSDLEYVDFAIKLMVDGEQKSLANCDLYAKEKKQVKITYTPKNYGFYQGVVSIDDYPMDYDNQYFFVFKIEEKVKVLVLNDEVSDTPFKRLYRDSSLFDFQSVNYKKADYSKLSEYNLVIVNEINEISSGLNNEFKNFLSAGGGLVFIPGDGLKEADLNNFTSSFGLPFIGAIDTNDFVIKSFEKEHPFFDGVFKKMKENNKLIMPSFKGGRNSKLSSLKDVILKADNNNPVLSLHYYRNSEIYLFHTALNNSNSDFYKHGLFVPIGLKMAFRSKGSSQHFLTMQKNLNLTIKKEKDLFLDQLFLQNANGGGSYKPYLKSVGDKLMINIPEDLQEAGFFNVTSKDKIVTSFALNYSRNESNPAYYNASELYAWVEEQGFKNVEVLNNDEVSVNQSIKSDIEGETYWESLIIIALLCLFAEGLLLRSWRKKEVVDMAS